MLVSAGDMAFSTTHAQHMQREADLDGEGEGWQAAVAHDGHGLEEGQLGHLADQAVESYHRQLSLGKHNCAPLQAAWLCWFCRGCLLHVPGLISSKLDAAVNHT